MQLGCLGLVSGLVSVSLAAQQSAHVPNETGRRVSVGDYKLYLDCTGGGPGPTVILIGSAMHDTQVWNKVQPAVATSAKVCSYDRMGVGKSDAVLPPRQTAWEIVEDLHTLLTNAGVARRGTSTETFTVYLHI